MIVTIGGSPIDAKWFCNIKMFYNWIGVVLWMCWLFGMPSSGIHTKIIIVRE